jgi:cytidylate kinase
VQSPHFVVTIDGPAASGKSSVSRELAKRLGWKWVSTGAFYRGLAYVAAKENIPATNVGELVELAHSKLWEVQLDEDLTRVKWRGQDVTEGVYAESTGTLASQVSQIPEVREALLTGQRDCSRRFPGLVAEGRDCGTVVFPQAILKVYLTASQEIRAKRRAIEQGLNVEETVQKQKVRDQADSSRAAAPMKVPENAMVIDSNGLSLEQVVEKIHKSVMAQSVKSF